VFLNKTLNGCQLTER